MQHASPHIRTALAIGALAPALRLGTILGLRWDQHFDPQFRYITVTDHKTDRDHPELVVPVTAQLQAILVAAHATWKAERERNARIASAVVQFRRRAVKSIKKALREAARRAKCATA